MMKRLFYLILSMVVFAGCHKDDNGPVIKDFTVDASGNIEVEMVYVKGGTFRMGATEDQGDEASNREHPVVTLSDYYIGKFEVTQGLWEEVMGTTIKQQRDKEGYYNHLYGIGSDYPMYYVNWEDAQEFCRKLSQLTGRKYALPTSAQWEYAARGGEKSKGYKYSGSDDIDKVAWYADNSRIDSVFIKSHPVGKKQANELGIYDMSGNVEELCQDWCEDYSYSEVQTTPTGSEIGSIRVWRGGSFCDEGWHCEVLRWSSYSLWDVRRGWVGFRVVCLP